MQTALYERPEILNRVRVYAAIYVLNRMVNDLVSVILVQSGIGFQRVSVERRACFDLFPNQRLQVMLAALLNNLSANLPAALHESDYDRLIVIHTASHTSLAALVHVARFSADESLVHFHFAPELGAKEIILHRKPDAVKHEPRRLLSNLYIAGDLIAADPVFAVSDKPSCSQPLIQGNRGIFHYSSDLDGELALGVMGAALPDASVGMEFNLVRSASRAEHATIFPAAYRQVVNAVIGIREIHDGFLKALWFAHGRFLHAQTLAN